MKNVFNLGLVIWLASLGVTRAQLAITEITTSAATNLGPAVVAASSDFWELSNFGTNAIDLTGYRWNDNAGGLIGADPTPFTGVIIGPGESILFFESNVLATASAAQFRAWWGLPASVRAFPYLGNGLSSSGDSVLLWGPAAANDADLVDGVVFGAALRGSTFTYNPLTGIFDRFSTNGVALAFKAATTDDVGSPGTNTGPVALGILAQPQNLSVNPGDTATFTVGWRGLPRPKFQWQFEGVDLPGARAATLAVANVQLDKLGHYRVVLDNGVDITTSSNATLVLNPLPEPPVFIVSPQNKSLFVGQSGTFIAQASGVPQPTYQWRRNDVDISGATGAAYTIFSAAQSTNPPSGGHNDWWELTNFDDFTVDLRNWRFDDGSATLAASTVLSNAMTIAPGESVIFVEGMTPEAFRTWWGVENLPPNLQVITYTGAGLSLSSLGDAVNVWNTGASEDFDTIASDVFSTAALGVTFGWNPDPGYFGDASVEGLYGAFRAAQSGDIGSPGYIRAPLRPRLLGLTRENDGFHLRWTARSGRTYTVQFKYHLEDATWTTLVTLPGADPFLTAVDPEASAAQKFYRIVIEP